MRKSLIFGLFILIVIISSGCYFKVINKREAKEFEYHFAILDSIEKIVPNDTLVNVLESIAFMESKTGIEASSDGTLIGRLACTKNDLRKWHEWYTQNIGKKKK